MADIVTPEVRSRMMSRIRSKDTLHEVKIRKALHAGGFRYRLHRRDLPGKPDITLPRYRATIFVHGCFWHGHDCHLFRWPTTRPEFWADKIGKNKQRDRQVRTVLRGSAWRCLIIWECALKGKYKLEFDDLISRVKVWATGSSDECEIAGEQIC